jgi:hypothetical protein
MLLIAPMYAGITHSRSIPLVIPAAARSWQTGLFRHALVGAILYWLLQPSVRKIDSLVFQHPPTFLCHVILNHGRSRKIFLLYERMALQRANRALPCSIHSGNPCKGCNRDLSSASSHMMVLSGYASYTRCTIERAFTDSGHPLIVMMEPTQYRNSDHLVPCLRRGKR